MMKKILSAVVVALVLALTLSSADRARAGGSAPNFFTLTLAGSSLCLTAPASPGVGSRVFLEPCATSASQLWWLNGDELVLSGTALCLDAGASFFNGASVALNACSSSGAPPQQWTRIPINANDAASPRLWVITGSKFCLQPYAPSAGVSVAVFECTTLPAQRWL